MRHLLTPFLTLVLFLSIYFLNEKTLRGSEGACVKKARAIGSPPQLLMMKEAMFLFSYLYSPRQVGGESRGEM